MNTIADVVQFEIHGDIAILTLDRPPVNALNDEMADGFDRALDLVDTSNAKVMLIRSTGEKVFCPGADISYIGACIEEGAQGIKRMLTFVKQLQEVYQRIESSTRPSVIALDGATTGGGLELALACDLRVVGSSIRLGLPEVKIGLLPGAGGTQRLTRLTGRGVASRLILDGELIDGTEANELGIAQYVVQRDDVFNTSLNLAKKIATYPAGALARAKQCIAMAASSEGYDAELRGTEELLKDPSTAVLIKQFLSKRQTRS